MTFLDMCRAFPIFRALLNHISQTVTNTTRSAHTRCTISPLVLITVVVVLITKRKEREG